MLPRLQTTCHLVASDVLWRGSADSLAKLTEDLLVKQAKLDISGSFGHAPWSSSTAPGRAGCRDQNYAHSTPIVGDMKFLFS